MRVLEVRLGWKLDGSKSTYLTWRWFRVQFPRRKAGRDKGEERKETHAIL